MSVKSRMWARFLALLGGAPAKRLHGRRGRRGRRGSLEMMHRAVVETLEPRQLMSAYQISGPTSVEALGTYELTLTTDSGSMQAWAVDWGDGQTSTTGGDATAAQHHYAYSGGTFAITAVAMDGEGMHGANSLVVDTAFGTGGVEETSYSGGMETVVGTDGGVYRLEIQSEELVIQRDIVGNPWVTGGIDLYNPTWNNVQQVRDTRIARDSAGGILMAGVSSHGAGDPESILTWEQWQTDDTSVRILRFDSNGNQIANILINTSSYVTSSVYYDRVFGLASNENNCIAVGLTTEAGDSGLVLTFDGEGQLVYSGEIFAHLAHGTDTNPMAVLSNGNVVVACVRSDGQYAVNMGPAWPNWDCRVVEGEDLETPTHVAINGDKIIMGGGRRVSWVRIGETSPVDGSNGSLLIDEGASVMGVAGSGNEIRIISTGINALWVIQDDGMVIHAETSVGRPIGLGISPLNRTRF